MGYEVRKLEDFPPYAAAVAKRAELQGEFADVTRQIADVNKGLARPDGGRLEAEALVLLDGGEPDLLDKTALRETLGSLLRRQNVLALATDKQGRRVIEQQAAASKEICKVFHREWSGMVQAIRDAARKLSDVGQKEHDLRESLRRSGVFIVAPMSDAAGCTDSLLWSLARLSEEADKALS